jgi:hypothetical protein
MRSAARHLVACTEHVRAGAFLCGMTSRIAKLLLPVAFAAAGTGVFAVAAPAQAATPTCNTIYVRHVRNTYANYPANGSNTACLMGNGNAGSAVRALQRGLNKCYSAHLTVDGIFGGNTAKALAAAQRQAGVDPDGVYGPQTARAIKFPYYDENTDAYIRCAHQ